MDNKHRAEEKLAGKMPLGIDKRPKSRSAAAWSRLDPGIKRRPRISPSRTCAGSVGASTGSPVRGQSTADRRSREDPALGQACTETTCKNIDVELAACGQPRTAPAPPPGLIPVKN